jgi:nitrate/TMAO reductase-like tetraheme cytochrome c subunit
MTRAAAGIVTENQPMSTPNSSDHLEPSPPPGHPAAAAGSAPARPRRWLMRIGVTAGVLLLVGAIGLGSAEYYTSRPKFCGSCHIMDPYYESWSRDIHGAKIGALCIDCHYAPGEQHTIKAKFKGLSQVASYFSGRYGTGRPRAHVDDDSCLRSGCHGDQAFSSKPLLIGEPRTESRLVGEQAVNVQRSPSVHFMHSKHLEVTQTRGEIERAIAETTERIREAAGAERLAKISNAARSVGPAARRNDALDLLLVELSLPEAVRKDAATLMSLEHRRIRVDQLDGLTCSACHTFDASLKSHVAADRQVCFTCHFANEEFNRNTGECLRCHEPPRRSVSVHPDATKSAQAVLMDHEDIVRRGVDCASCHLDVLRGDARVSERECTHCHDQARFLDEFATRTTETVRKYHEAHVAGQRAHCFDCHRAIQHGLIDASTTAATGGGFLEPVLNNCQHCHPNHHAEQVALLTGTGGVQVDHSTPSAMVGSRLNCRACHTEVGEGGKGDAVMRAARQSCVACHSDEYMKMYDSWKREIETYLVESEARLARSEKAAADRGVDVAERVNLLLSAARSNIHLVRAGGGLHNRAYALQLLDMAGQQLSQAEQLLPPPR